MNEIFIGDNLTIMKSEFFEQYKENIKMIYIDPPYNTGSIFSYNDKRKENEWQDFMYKRLVCAKNLLKEDGAIFISIDDSEYALLKIICDKIFDKENFVGTFITNQAKRSNAKHINTVHEYILCYAKNKDALKPFKIKRIDIPSENKMITSMQTAIKKCLKEEGMEKAEKKLQQLIKSNCLENNITWLKNYSNIDEKGNIYFAKDLSTPGKPRKVDIPEINLKLEPLETRGWSSDKKFKELHEKNMLCFKGKRPYEKHLLIDAVDNVPSILNFYSRQGTKDLKNLGLQDIFDTPKPVELIKFLSRLVLEDNDILLDFFAGSGTSAQAIYELNKEDKKENKYILVQLNEKIDSKKPAYKFCVDKKITPEISEAMIYRIDTFLEKNNLKKDYNVTKLI